MPKSGNFSPAFLGSLTPATTYVAGGGVVYGDKNNLINSIHNLSEIVFPDELLFYGHEFGWNGKYRLSADNYGDEPMYRGIGQNIKITFGKKQWTTGLWRNVNIDTLDIPCLIVSKRAFEYDDWNDGHCHWWPFCGRNHRQGDCNMDGYIKRVNIQSQVIGQSAFAKQTKLESVTLGKEIKIIGDNAFYNCKNLKELIIPEEVKTICFSLEKVVIFERRSSSIVDKFLNAIKSKLGIETSVDEKIWDVQMSKSDNFNTAFKGCSSLPIKTQQRLRELGYKGPF